jgi:RNA polymerase-binding transcription factor DksA
MIDTTTYRARLEEEKGTLETELESVGRRNPTNPNDWEAIPQEVGQESDPNDRADLITHFEDNTAILKDLEIRYNDVLAALARIDAGTYGTCEAGAEEIEEARLNADPAAKTCKAHLNG